MLEDSLYYNRKIKLGTKDRHIGAGLCYNKKSREVILYVYYFSWHAAGRLWKLAEACFNLGGKK